MKTTASGLSLEPWWNIGAQWRNIVKLLLMTFAQGDHVRAGKFLEQVRFPSTAIHWQQIHFHSADSVSIQDAGRFTWFLLACLVAKPITCISKPSCAIDYVNFFVNIKWYGGNNQCWKIRWKDDVKSWTSYETLSSLLEEATKFEQRLLEGLAIPWCMQNFCI